MEKRHRAKLIIYGALTLMCMAMIFYFSSQNGERSQGVSDRLLARIKALILLLPSITGKGAEYDIRKYAHMFEYCMLGITSMLFMRELLIKRLGTPAAPLAAWGFSFLYACSDELHQYFVPGRSAKFTDVMVDSVGFTLGVAAAYIICRVLADKKRGKTHE